MIHTIVTTALDNLSGEVDTGTTVFHRVEINCDAEGNVIIPKKTVLDYIFDGGQVLDDPSMMDCVRRTFVDWMLKPGISHRDNNSSGSH